MGRPQIGRRGFRGNRVDSSRAGITPKTLTGGVVLLVTILPCRARCVAAYSRRYALAYPQRDYAGFSPFGNPHGAGKIPGGTAQNSLSWEPISAQA